MSFTRTALRTSLRSLRTPRPTQFTRQYASEPSQSKKTSEMPIAVAVATVTAAGGYYLLQSGPEGKPQHESDESKQYAKGEAIESVSKASEATLQPDRDADQKVSSSGSSGGGSLGQPPSNIDPAGARKEEGGAGTISGKQAGLSNATTDNPFINEPGKSKKGEGETETAKVKGSVSPSRPQV
ncbi:uncharacterized protein ASPGLDRAFT_70684 [Aspergillus glaucus CBS 516.65]|uniref:Uncharacterized protein n=1 Tax=Aspergillus glaucus CBS 516.65 TaxID=1160497 RepID=A0A1L9V3S9_ASPGL|nr:hypothetical protein ASPGLDRAFT_70684 [Aspergillus glaucus CBS 516.65]OJJ78577.1 hypothetical protein ASPGLDRAFT_70684 [Aspergillus glaucus CBS 516.65]